MIEVLPRGPAEGGAALDLLRRVLRNRAEFAAEYPLVFRSGFPGRLLALGERGEARSACALIARDFHLAGGLVLRGGLVGSVATDPAWRNRGLASRLLHEAEAALSAEGCAFALLWANDPDFYLRRGYCPIGVEHDFVVEGSVARALPRAEGVRELAPGDAAAVHRLYAAHPVRVGRAPEETEALLGCPGMRTLVLERAGAVVAYACLGHGADLRDVVHEWGGAAEDVLALVREQFERRFARAEPGRLYVMAPPGAQELRRGFAAAGAEPYLGFLGLAKLLDRGAVVRFLDERLRPEGGLSLAETPEGTRYLIRGPARESWIDDDAVLALLFPVSEVREKVEELLVDFGLAPGRLPLEPFAWGLDSI